MTEEQAERLIEALEQCKGPGDLASVYEALDSLGVRFTSQGDELNRVLRLLVEAVEKLAERGTP